MATSVSEKERKEREGHCAFCGVFCDGQHRVRVETLLGIEQVCCFTHGFKLQRQRKQEATLSTPD